MEYAKLLREEDSGLCLISYVLQLNSSIWESEESYRLDQGDKGQIIFECDFHHPIHLQD